MPTAATTAHEIDVKDVEYLRHPDRPLLARMFLPRGTGPFPMIVELHGGAWHRGDRLNDTLMNEALARSGVVVAALDFRQPPEASYPGSLVDVSYGVRWLKSHATDFRGRADRVGLMGASSGAHMAMLLAMKPRDPKYAALALPAGSPAVDGAVQCAVLCWPVIDPLGRYRYAKALKAGGPPYPDVVDRVLPGHESYWLTEEAMAEGNPTLALERGERVETPPVVYIQGALDQAHPRPDLDRFVAGYRKIGGALDLELIEGEAEGYMNKKPASPAVARTIARIIEFVHKQLGG
jgi:acetyl esterase/lipase